MKTERSSAEVLGFALNPDPRPKAEDPRPKALTSLTPRCNPGAIAPQDQAWRAKARERLDQLIMPHWALGRLMDLAVDLAGMTRSLRPPVGRKAVVVMAGDHGVADEGVSKYPREVTAQMVYGFAGGHGGHQRPGPAGRGPRHRGRHRRGRRPRAAGRGGQDPRPQDRPRHGQHRRRTGHDPRSRPSGPSRRASRWSKNWPTRSTCWRPATWASPTPRPRRPWPPR